MAVHECVAEEWRSCRCGESRAGLETLRMKCVLNRLAWAFAVTVLVYAAVGPGMGVLYRNPLACLGVGLIGLGLCVDSRRKLAAERVAQARDDRRDG